MKFSIIVPVYNAADFVSDTIENLLKQNVDKEIILVNDGSTDDSLNILLNYQKRYSCIKVFDKKNGGVASARNVGILNATGDYINFVDSDDFIDEDTLQKCEIVLANNNVDILIFTYRFCLPTIKNHKDFPELYKPSGRYTVNEWIDDYWTLDKLHIMHCIGTKIYNREILINKNLLFDENTDYCEDIGFCTAYMSYVNILYYINEPFYQYRMFNENNRISKFKPHLFQSKEYLHRQQINMFNHIYGTKTSYFHLLRKIYSNDIEECLYNLFKFKNVKYDLIHSELLRMAIFLKSHKEIIGNNILQNFYIFMLRYKSVESQVTIFQQWFSIYNIYKKTIGKYFKKIINMLKKFL